MVSDCWQQGRWRKARRFAAALSLASLLLIPAISLAAGPSAADRDRARDAMMRGDALLEKGNLAEALKLFQTADGIMAVPTTGLALAKALRMMGKLIEAKDVATRVSKSPVVAKELKAFAEARKAAAALATELDGQIPTIQVKLDSDSPVTQPEIRIDSDVLASDAADQPRKVDPGEHTVRVQAQGWQDATEQITVQAKENCTVRLRLKRANKSGESAAIVAPTDTPKPKSKRTSPLVYVGFGTAAVGVVAGTVSGLMSWSKVSSVKERCTGTVCPLSEKDTADSAKTLGWVSNISFGVGIAGAALGVVGLLIGGKRDPAKTEQASVRLTLAPSPSSISILGQF